MHPLRLAFDAYHIEDVSETYTQRSRRLPPTCSNTPQGAGRITVLTDYFPFQ